MPPVDMEIVRKLGLDGQVQMEAKPMHQNIELPHIDISGPDFGDERLFLRVTIDGSISTVDGSVTMQIDDRTLATSANNLQHAWQSDVTDKLGL